MSTTNRRCVHIATGAIMTGVIGLAVASCGLAKPAGSSPAAGPDPVHTVQPGSPVKVTISRAPRPGGFTTRLAGPVRHRKITAGSAGSVRLSAADAGATVVLKPGQVVNVVLGSRSGPLWNPIRLTGSAQAMLRQLSASGGYPSHTAARASYRAIRPGRSEIVSGTNAACLHQHPQCEIVQVLWRVIIIVQ